jgi:hypothetical protein
MKKNLRRLAGAAVGAVVALGFTSCAYDPYYSSTSVGGSYSSGYGQGYGYGGSSFSTSVFVSTGDPRWGYDPTCYSYYDYRRRAYYDPYLYGYYPVGYRPPVVYGVPHPYGWRPGSGYCRPPSRISNVTVVNYRNRESAYRTSDYQWARQVRQQPSYSRSYQQQRPAQGGYNRQDYNTRSSTGSRPYGSSSYDRNRDSGYQNYQAPRSTTQSRTRQESSPRIPSDYNTPVTEIQQAPIQESRRAPQDRQYNTQSRPEPDARREIRPLAEPDGQRSSPRPSPSFSRGGNREQAQPAAPPSNNGQQNRSFSRGNRNPKPEASEPTTPAPL